MPIVDVSTATTKKITIANLVSYLSSVAQTLTNKIIDGITNTLTNVTLTSIQVVVGEANSFIVRNSVGSAVAGTKTVPTGTVVGTTDQQTLTNKILQAPSFGGTAFGSAYAGRIINLSTATPVAIDASLGNIFRLAMLAGSVYNFGTPTGTMDGQKITLILHGSTGSATGTFVTGVAGQFAFGTDVSAIGQTGNGKRDFIGLEYNAAMDRWCVVAYVRGY